MKTIILRFVALIFIFHKHKKLFSEFKKGRVNIDRIDFKINKNPRIFFQFHFVFYENIHLQIEPNIIQHHEY